MQINILSSFFSLILLCFFVFNSQQTKAQSEGSEPTTFLKIPKVEPVFNFDFRNSFIGGNSIKFAGVKGGIMLKRKHRIGIGYYFLPERTHKQRNTISTGLADFSLRFQYFTVYYEYVALSRKRWEISLPFHIGLGNSYVHVTPANGEAYDTKHIQSLILEPSINAHYKIIRWVGIGAGVGYRFALDEKSQQQVDKRFTAPIYILKLKIFLKDIYHDLRAKR